MKTTTFLSIWLWDTLFVRGGGGLHCTNPSESIEIGSKFFDNTHFRSFYVFSSFGNARQRFICNRVIVQRLLHPPWAANLESFASKIKHFKNGGSILENVPVPCLLFAHGGIDSRLMFGHEDFVGKSVYNTVHEAWMKRSIIHEFTLDVVLINGRLFCLGNLRIAALRMVQALRWDELLWVNCRISDHRHPTFGSSYTTKCDGFGILPNQLSGIAEHEGFPVFNHRKAFVKQLEKIVKKYPDAKLKNIRTRGHGHDERLTEVPSELNEQAVEAPWKRRRTHPTVGDTYARVTAPTHLAIAARTCRSEIRR